MKRCIHTLTMTTLLSAAGGFLGATDTCRAQFASGDVYFISLGLPGAPCTAPGIMRITPGSWQTSVLTRLSSSMTGRGAYDSFRSRLLVTYIDSTIEMVDSAGVRTPLPYAGYGTAQLVAPTGDGRIYTWGSQITPVHYYDSANVVHSLMDSTGAATYLLNADVRALYYDRGTSSLFAAGMAAGDLTQVTKIPLNAAGTRVQGTITSVTFDGSPGNAGEVPLGFSRGPNGTLLLSIDDNSNATAGRLRLIDPVTLNVQVFATTGYQGVAAETAGAYVPLAGGAVVLDSFGDVLRLFHAGETGAGTLLPVTGVSGTCGSGESAQFVIIDPPVCRADFNGDHFVNSQDFFDFIGAFFSLQPAADFNHDTFINSQDYFDFLSAFFAGC